MKRQITLTLLPIGLVIFCLIFGRMTIAAPRSLDKAYGGDTVVIKSVDPTHGALDGPVAIRSHGKVAHAQSTVSNGNDFALVVLMAQPVTITVTNTNDSGDGSLRQAVADATPGGTINFDLGVFATPQTITLTSGQLFIDKNLTIHGPGANLLSIRGNHASRVLYVDSGVTASITGMTISDGYASTGGGIRNDGTLSVSNSIVSGNNAPNDGYYGYGGGIFNLGSSLTVTNVTISNNQAYWRGGGIYNASSLTVINSTVSGNTNVGPGDFRGGGGIFNGATAFVTNSTIAGNSTDGIYNEGGVVTVGHSIISGNTGSGVFNGAICFGNFEECHGGMAYVANSTITGNTTGYSGMQNTGVTCNGNGCGSTAYFTNSTITGNTRGISSTFFNGINQDEMLSNSIVAGNNGGDIEGAIEEASHNLIGDAASSGGIVNGVNGNIVGVNPLLGPLRNNGGPTMTHALLSESPAINAGENALALGETDQRGPGFPRIRSGTVDIGAFEFLAAVSVWGRVTRPDGLGVGKATVWITDSLGVRRTALTSSFGFYSFDNVAAGGTYAMGALSKLYRFSERHVQVDTGSTGVDFVAIE